MTSLCHKYAVNQQYTEGNLLLFSLTHSHTEYINELKIKFKTHDVEQLVLIFCSV